MTARLFILASILLTGALFVHVQTTNGQTTNAQTANAQITNAQTYRPGFHFTTDSNWINDPNGLVYYKGRYHLFCQYNPYGDKWGHMSWAHASSTDLFHWEQEPLAIKEFSNKDGSVTMIFSGSVVVDSFNTSGFGKKGQTPLVAIFTSHIDKQAQHQSIAFSLDDGKTWERYKGNPVLDIHSTEFRDPKVFWYYPEKKWVMAVSKPDQYRIRFYESKNLKNWKYLSEFGGIGNMDNVWECPDLFEAPVEESNVAENKSVGSKTEGSNGVKVNNGKKWVLTVSAGHAQKGFVAMQYFVGDFNGHSFTVDPNPYPLYVDYGKDFYAGITFNDLPATDGRKILLGWANDWKYANDIPTKGFRGQYATPRSLQLRKTGEQGFRLIQSPVEELTPMAKDIQNLGNLVVNDGIKELPATGDASLDIEFDLKLDNAEEAGLFLYKSGEEKTVISLDRKKAEVLLDRTKSGQTEFSDAFSSVDAVKVGGSSDRFHFRILADQCLVEVFVNGGEYVVTDLVFPKGQQGGLELFSKGGAALFSNVIIRKMNKTMH
ncbi:glycoside hydrolase family 32 protein [Flavitalea flava]